MLITTQSLRYNIVAEGLPDLLEFLIESLADKSSVNVVDNSGSTPAHDASEFGERDTLLILLKYGADISMMNQVNIGVLLLWHYLPLQSGETPFDLAVQNNHNDLIGILADFRENKTKALQSYVHDKSDSVSTCCCNEYI